MVPDCPYLHTLGLPMQHLAVPFQEQSVTHTIQQYSGMGPCIEITKVEMRVVIHSAFQERL